MYKAFKAPDSVDPWDLLFHRVAILDAAAAIAEKEQDVDMLIEISNRVAECSDELIQIYLLLTQEQEEGEADNEPARPIGFVHEPKADED